MVITKSVVFLDRCLVKFVISVDYKHNSYSAPLIWPVCIELNKTTIMFCIGASLCCEKFM